MGAHQVHAKGRGRNRSRGDRLAGDPGFHASRDAALLAGCFAEDAEPAFRPIRAGRLTDDQLAELRARFGSSEIIGVAPTEDVRVFTVAVTVPVTVPEGDGEGVRVLWLVRDEAGAWRIVGF